LASPTKLVAREERLSGDDEGSLLGGGEATGGFDERARPGAGHHHLGFGEPRKVDGMRPGWQAVAGWHG